MDIQKRYSSELNKINSFLTDLERGRIYELTHTPGDASYTTLSGHLKESISSLLNKIENNEPGNIEKAAEAFKRI